MEQVDQISLTRNTIQLLEARLILLVRALTTSD